MTREEMGVDHGHVASVVEGVGEFVKDVLSQDVVIQLPGTPHVEGKASHLAFHFAVSGLVHNSWGPQRRNPRCGRPLPTRPSSPPSNPPLGCRVDREGGSR